MAECRSIDEYLRGPDGDESRGIAPTLRDVLEDPRLEDVDDIMVRCSTVPAGTSSTRKEWTSYLPKKASVDQMIEALGRKLEQSPSDLFAGQLRLNFYPKGQSSEYIGSHSRQMRPGISLDVQASGGISAAGDIANVHAVFIHLVKPLGDMVIRQADSTARLAEACAKVVEANKPAPQQVAGGGGLMADLVRGAVGIAANTDSPAPQQGSAPVGPQPVTAPTTPTNPTPPQPPAPVDEAAVRKWLDENPGKAQSIGADMLGRFGMKVVPVGAS